MLDTIDELNAYKFISETNTGNNNYYHNFMHLFNVYNACKLINKNIIFFNVKDFRYLNELYIAALFHDYNHVGKQGDDSINIQAAYDGVDNFFEIYNCKLDKQIIKKFISYTEFPYTVESKDIPMYGKIIRDADMFSLFQDECLIQNYYGLRKEWNMEMKEFLDKQKGFIENIKWNIDFLQDLWVTKQKEINLGLINNLYQIS